MRRKVLLPGLLILALGACKEVPPFIDLHPTVAIDTTYKLSSVPPADPHNILLEDLTGQSCPNCPAAHDVIETLKTQNPGRINAIGWYDSNYGDDVPPSGNKYDFRSDTAHSVITNLFRVIIGEPVGVIDRRPSSTNSVPYENYSDAWGGIVSSLLGTTDSINVSVLTKHFDPTTRIANVQVTVTYLYPTSTVHNMSIVVVEDSMVDVQLDNRAPTGVDQNYVFTDVFRTMLSSVPFGDPVAPKNPVKEAGRVYQRFYTYKVPANFVPQHCRVIAFVHDPAGSNAGKHVYQSAEAPLVP